MDKMSKNPIELIKKYTKHDYIALTSRGNTAIESAFNSAIKLSKNKKVLVPDQGGWFSYFKYPKKMGMEVLEVKTDYGIIDLNDLKKKLDDACCFIYSNPAGYFAEQPIKEIYSICKGKCLVIMDVTGSIGDKDMSDGDYADFMVCSFGEWKPVNLGYGGVISAKEDTIEVQEKSKFDPSFSEKLYVNLSTVDKRLNGFYNEAKKIKNDLQDFDILHRDKTGINVIVKFNNEPEKTKITDYCEKNKYEYTLCPRYIRVNEKAISIEVKRL